MVSYFSQYGTVLNAYIIYDPNTKVSKNFGYVEFETVEQADLVMKTEVHKICGKRVTIEKQKSGVNTTQQLEKRVEDEKKKLSKVLDPRGTVKNQPSSMATQLINDKISILNTQVRAFQSVTVNPSENAPNSRQNMGGDINNFKNVSKPWLQVGPFSVPDQANYAFRIETEQAGILRSNYWTYKLQYLLAVRTSNTLCA